MWKKKKKKSISRGISGVKQVIKFANTSNRGGVSLFSQKDTKKMYGSTFDKIYVIIACCEDIYGSYCIPKKIHNNNNKVK